MGSFWITTLADTNKYIFEARINVENDKSNELAEICEPY